MHQQEGTNTLEESTFPGACLASIITYTRNALRVTSEDVTIIKATGEM